MARMSDEILKEVLSGAKKAEFDSSDALYMVNSLARRRRIALNSSADDAQRFSGVVLCFIFAPVKGRNSAYVKAMREIRENFRGIFLDLTLQDAFEETLSSEFISAETVDDAVEMGAQALFASRFIARGAY